jgi:hypothetical protein
VSEHLSAGDLHRYKKGKADPAILLSWDDHLSACPACQGRLGSADSLAVWGAGLASDDGDHLTYEQLAARAENRVGDANRFAIESHLKQCSSCAEELADLKRFAAAAPETKRGARIWPWLAAVAAALLVVGGAVAVLSRHPQQRAPVAVVNIPADWPAADRALVEEALRSGKLPSAPLPPDLASKEGRLLGPSTADPFAPIAPLGEVVESDRPDFRWQPFDRATSFRVEVYDSGFHPVLRSLALTETAWTPPKPLTRGELYRWQIVAQIGANTISVPSPPAPAAVFRILDAATEARVAQARASGPMGHLLAAALLSQAGMEPESRKELDALPAETRALPQIGSLIR